MRQKSDQPKEPAEKVIKKIRCVTRKQYSAEEKIRMVQKARAKAIRAKHAQDN